MKETQVVVVAYDDLARADGDKVTGADQEVSVGYMGLWWNLDLTKEHDAELAAFLARYMAAGKQTREPHRGHRARTVPKEGMRAAKARRARMREFAEANQIPYEHEGRGKNRFFYSLELEERFAAWEASQQQAPVMDGAR